LVLLFDGPTAGQTNPKTAPKLKPGAPLVADPNDLPKPGAPLSAWALVQRPPALKNVRSWSIETKRHRWVVVALSIRPDGKKLATSGHDGIVRIWDVETGELERALLGHEVAAYGVAWSPDGKYLASAGYYSARVWDGATGMQVRNLKGKQGVTLVAWSPDGTKLLTGGGGSGGIALWDVAAAKLLSETEYGTQIASISFSSSGEQVATAATRAGTYIADTANKLKTVHTFKDAADPDAAVAFSPDGKLLAAGSAKQVVVYNTATGAVVRKLAEPGLALIWTPNGGLLVVGSGYQVTPHTPGELAPEKPLPGTAGALSLTADGTHLFGLNSGVVTQWDLEKKTTIKSYTVGEIMSIACGQTPIVLVRGTEEVLWDAMSGKKIGALEKHTGEPAALGWSPMGKFLAVADIKNAIRVYDPPTGKLLRTLAAPAAVSLLAVAVDGRVAAVTADKKVVVWAVAGDDVQYSLVGHKNLPRALAWSRDGKLLATGEGKDIFLWSIDTGKQVKALEHPRDLLSLTWSPDGKQLWVGCTEEVTLAAYQAATWKLQPAIDRGPSSLAAVTFAWSPDGTNLLGYRSGAIQQWNAKTGKLGPAFGFQIGATTLAFSPDGKTIQGGCADRVVRYWDAANGKPRLTVVADRAEIIAVSVDGNYRVPEAAEPEIIAVVLTDKGQETVPLKELTAKYGFKNMVANVK
jgi:WD40 repeat protein